MPRWDEGGPEAVWRGEGGGQKERQCHSGIYKGPCEEKCHKRKKARVRREARREGGMIRPYLDVVFRRSLHPSPRSRSEQQAPALGSRAVQVDLVGAIFRIDEVGHAALEVPEQSAGGTDLPFLFFLFLRGWCFGGLWSRSRGPGRGRRRRSCRRGGGGSNRFGQQVALQFDPRFRAMHDRARSDDGEPRPFIKRDQFRMRNQQRALDSRTSRLLLLLLPRLVESGEVLAQEGGRDPALAGRRRDADGMDRDVRAFGFVRRHGVVGQSRLSRQGRAGVADQEAA